MEKTENVTIVWKQSNPLIKAVLAILIAVSLAALMALGWVHTGIRNQTEQMLEQARELEVRNEDLKRRIKAFGTEQSVREIARDELGMVPSTAVLVQPE